MQDLTPVPRRFVGGLRIFRRGTTAPGLFSVSLKATTPLAELLVDDQRVLLRLRWAWVRGFFSVASLFGIATSWEAPRGSVSAEESEHRLYRGVLLRSPGLPPAIFWCADRSAVLAALAPPEPS